LPFLADEILLFTIKEEPFACVPVPELLVTIPELAAFFGGLAFDLFEFYFAIIICLVNDVNIDRTVTMLYHF